MKKFTFIMFYIFISFYSYTQTATNFISNDCSGLSHNLFSELDEGKVIVICWVMPCSGCINPASTAYNVVNNFQTNYPNKVYYYLTDDYANDNCADLSDWATNFNIPESAFSRRFSDSNISMYDYDTPGMPKVVVIAGAGHNVFFNENAVINAHILTSSIDNAIIASGVNSLSSSKELVQISPNPANETLTFSFPENNYSEISIELYNSFGAKISDIPYEFLDNEDNIFKINSSQINAGVYYFHIKGSSLSITKKVVVVH